MKVPPCLARLAELDLSDARGRPTALARLVFVVLLLHARDDPPLAWPGVARLADLTGADPSSVHKALDLLRERGAIERVSKPAPKVARGWRIVLPAPDGDDCERVRVFWPRPMGARGEPDTVFRDLVRGLGNRNAAAIAVMLYQFAREPAHAALEPCRPNQAWIARLLDTDESTVSRVKRDLIARGLATAGPSRRLVFEDPGRWAELLGLTPGGEAANGDACPREPAANGDAYPREPAANGNAYPCEDATPADTLDNPPDPLAAVERELAVAGWILPADPLAREIIVAGVERWGLAETLARLRAALAGPYPSYALEPLGAALGERFECPYQLVRVDPDIP